MKNVVIFQDFIDEKTYGYQWREEELYNYFRAQIDNSIDFGWKSEDIVIVTNLDFKYRDVSILNTKMLCTYNKYFNKVFGIYELLKDWLEFDVNNSTKHDASMASGFTLLASQKHIKPKIKISTTLPFVRKYSNNGKISKIIR